MALMLFLQVNVLTLLVACFNAGGHSGSLDCLPGGVADIESHRAYLARENKSIDAIDLQNGNTVWTSAEASVPLALSDRMLVAADYSLLRSGRFKVVILGAHDGNPQMRSEAILLGQPVPPEEPLKIKARIEKGGVFIEWTTSSRYRSGAAPPVQRANAIPKETAHAAIMDLTTGKVSEQPPETTEIVSKLDSGNSLPYRRLTSWEKGPWLVGESVADIEQTSERGIARAQLRVWDGRTHALKITRDLAPVDSGTTPYVTGDGKNVLVRSSAEGGHLWRIYSVQAGQEVGQVLLDSSAQTICIQGSKLFYSGSTSSSSSVVDIFLRCIDIPTGHQLWEHSLGTRRIANAPPLPK